MIKMWDKQESINGVSAVDYMKDNPLINGDILLITDDNTGIITQVLNVNVLRSNLNLNSSLTSLEVGEAYLKSLDNSNMQQSDETIDEEKVSTAEALIDLDTRLLALENK